MFTKGGSYLLCQEIPREELEAEDADKVIGVFHFSKDLSRTHGVPFKFVVKKVHIISAQSLLALLTEVL